MALKWWKPLYGFMFLATLPFFIILNFLSLEYGMLVLWLFKPWFERGLLYIYSRQVFGQPVSIKETFSAWPSQIRPLWLASVTWLRLSPSRAFDLPVSQLEGLSGERRASRLRVLHQTNDDNTGWWTLICVHWEGFILLGLIVMINMLLPETMELSLWDEFGILINDYVFGYNVLWYLAIVAVAPLYVGGAFAAYLNRRILLEGWDIELNFKKMRQAALNKGQGVIALLLVCFIGFNSPEVSALHIQEAEQSTPSSEEAAESEENEETVPEKHVEIRKSLEDIFDNPPFSEKETYTDWRWTGWKREIEEPEEETDMSWLMPFLLMLATFSEIILWVVFSLLLGLILWLSREHIARLFNYRLPKREVVELPSFSRHYQKKSLPDDIPEELKRLLEENAYRQVLSLLLVSSLIHLHKAYALPLTESMTELECLDCIKLNADQESTQYMNRLIDTWIQLAWAHQWPANENMQELVDRWQVHFVSSPGGDNT